jgi:hypothetical protein
MNPHVTKTVASILRKLKLIRFKIKKELENTLKFLVDAERVFCFCNFLDLPLEMYAVF